MKTYKEANYCHNCGQTSDWSFEEREGNQIIKCPICGHMHYRRVDASYIDFSINFNGEVVDNYNRIEEILKEYPESKEQLDLLLATLEFGSVEDIKKLSVSDDRWGQDPSQNNSFTSTQVQWAYNANSTTSYSFNINYFQGTTTSYNGTNSFTQYYQQNINIPISTTN